MTAATTSVLSIKPSGGPFWTLDPFLFCAYHRDFYPAGDEKMEAPRLGNGMDFDPDADYRMYHGDRIPGFPQHPHRGFETLTAVIEGYCDHTDSLGSYGRFGNGDLQWMSAGSGVVHGENFPLVHKDKPNTLRLFQIWLNLEAKNKMTPPGYVMNWNEDKVVIDGENDAKLMLFAGELKGKKGGNPPAHSWAADPAHDVGVYYIQLPKKGSAITLEPAKYASSTSKINRLAHVVEGPHARFDADTVVKGKYGAVLDATKETTITNISDEPVDVLVLQGKPIGEPVAQRGPFVMNTQQELIETYMAYQRTQFGGWPWKEDAVVFPRTKGRFAVTKKGEAEFFPGSKIIE